MDHMGAVWCGIGVILLSLAYGSWFGTMFGSCVLFGGIINTMRWQNKMNKMVVFITRCTRKKRRSTWQATK